jgi:hypothetical protein
MRGRRRDLVTAVHGPDDAAVAFAEAASTPRSS